MGRIISAASDIVTVGPVLFAVATRCRIPAYVIVVYGAVALLLLWLHRRTRRRRRRGAPRAPLRAVYRLLGVALGLSLLLLLWQCRLDEVRIRVRGDGADNECRIEACDPAAVVLDVRSPQNDYLAVYTEPGACLLEPLAQLYGAALRELPGRRWEDDDPAALAQILSHRVRVSGLNQTTLYRVLRDLIQAMPDPGRAHAFAVALYDRFPADSIYIHFSAEAEMALRLSLLRPPPMVRRTTYRIHVRSMSRNCEVPVRGDREVRVEWL